MENCPHCGRPLGEKALIATCGECLNERYLVELYAREAQHLAESKEPCLTVATQGLRHHLVLAVDHTRTYCDTRVTAQPHKKIRYPLATLPDLCEACGKKLATVRASIRAMATKEPWS